MRRFHAVGDSCYEAQDQAVVEENRAVRIAIAVIVIVVLALAGLFVYGLTLTPDTRQIEQDAIGMGAGA